MTAPLIGLMGQKRSGKDTFAGFLVERHGYVRLAFADALRDALLRVNPLVGRGHLRVSDVIATVGWEGAKGSPSGPEIRHLLQEFGMAVRDTDPDFWIRSVMRRSAALREDGTPVVVTDVRFPNEADAIERQGGILVRIDRPGLPDDDQHPSEYAWRGVLPKFRIDNDADLTKLGRDADAIASIAGALV